MEKLKDDSVSSLRNKPNQTISVRHNGNSNENYYEKLKKRTALIEELETKIDALNVSKEEKDAISDAINIVFTWDKTENQQLRAENDSLLNDLDICSDESGQRNEKMQRIITEKERTIDELNQKISQLEPHSLSIIRNAIAPKDEKKDALLKVVNMYEQNERLKVELSTAKCELTKLKSDVDQKDYTITFWKQKCEESHAQNGELNQKIARLEARLQNDVHKPAVASNDNVSDVKTLYNGNTASRSYCNNNSAHKDTTTAQYFIQMKNVVVDGEINYELLKGKILLVYKIMPVYEDFQVYYYNDDREEKMVKLRLDDSFKLRLTGKFCRRNGYYPGFVRDLCKHIHSCALKSLSLQATSLKNPYLFKDFLKLVESRTIVDLYLNGDVKDDENGNDVPLENLLQYFPNLNYSKIDCMHTYKKETAANLLKLPVFKNLKKFELLRCPREVFDLETFGDFMKEHYWAKFIIKFEGNWPPQRCDQHRYDRDELLQTWPKNAPQPDIGC